MNEQAPTPEEPKEKITIKCWKCDHNVRSSLDNTMNLLFTKQPWFNHTQMMCMDEDCEAVTILFHDTVDDRNIAKLAQYPVMDSEYCDDPDIQGIRRKVTGAEDLHERELSKRNADMVARWGEFLQRITVDQTDFGGGSEAA